MNQSMRYVELEMANDNLEGLLVKEDEKHVVIKLKNGYNIGISKKKILNIKDKHQPIYDTAQQEKKQAIEQKHDLPKVLILHTGGTIASKVDYKTGGVISKFSPEDILSMFPELKEIAKIDSMFFRNMWSDDMRFEHYNLIAKEIQKQLSEHKDIKGIILTQGTDTMHYTGAALSFIFENIHIPVVIVGSQRSSDRGSSDASINLISAITFIANTTLAGVFICMHENMADESCIVLNGINARKMHSSRRDAFKSINKKPVARVNFFTKDIDYISEYPNSSLNGKGALKLHLFNEDLKIGFIKSHPSMYAKEIEFYDDFDGVILEGTGLGHFPISEIDEFTKEHAKIKAALAKLCTKIPVVMTLQTIYGKVDMNVYSPGRELLELGVIGNYSGLTIENAFIKLAWLLSQKLDPKIYFMQDLRGEFSSREIDAE